MENRFTINKKYSTVVARVSGDKPPKTPILKNELSKIFRNFALLIYIDRYSTKKYYLKRYY